MNCPVLLFACTGVDPAPWLAGLAAEFPDLEVRLWPDIGDPSEIDYAFVWKPPAEVFAGLPNLKLIFCLGAGVDALLGLKVLPRDIPLVRMVDPGLAVGMNEFVLMQVLHYHRRMHDYAALQKEARWEPLDQKLPEDRVVGIMGLGNLGSTCAKSLVSLGFDVRGWSRSPKQVEGVRSFAGEGGLGQFLRDIEILVCLLPLTPETAGIIDADLLARLPAGACLINVARGPHLVDADLLAALDSGHLAGATLDVFHQEPLASDHPYWRHPKVIVIPHSSALTQPKTAVRTLAANLRRAVSGQNVENIVDIARGY